MRRKDRVNLSERRIKIDEKRKTEILYVFENLLSQLAHHTRYTEIGVFIL